MKRPTIALVALLFLSCFGLLLVLAGACEGDACTKDTDCQMPLICVASACVPVGPKPDAAADGDAEPEVDGDTPPRDGDGDGEAEEGGEGADDDGDVPDELDVTDDSGGGCTPVTSLAYNIAPTAADAEERPLTLPSEDGFATLIRLPGTVAADGLRFQRFQPDGTSGTHSAVWTLSSVEIGPSHPFVELPSGEFAVAFSIPEGLQTGIWMKITAATGGGGTTPSQIPGTTASSTAPTLTFDDTDLVVAWVESNSGAVEIRGQFVSADTGVARGSYVTIAAGPSGTKEPRIVWGDIRHVLAYFNASDGALHILSLDGTLVVTRDDPFVPATGQSLVGYPAVAWNGTEFGVAWETRGTSSSTMHLATFLPDTLPVDHEPLAATVPLAGTEQGQLGLAWSDVRNEWAIAWRFNRVGRVSISLARISATDFRLVAEPIDLRTEATTGFHPCVSHHAGYYQVTWSEVFGATYPLYEATHGCTP
jgi:hypothetical protein